MEFWIAAGLIVVEVAEVTGRGGAFWDLEFCCGAGMTKPGMAGLCEGRIIRPGRCCRWQSQGAAASAAGAGRWSGAIRRGARLTQDQRRGRRS